MRTQSILLIALFVISMLGTLSVSAEEQSQAKCNEYARPNIDCVCVAGRMQTFWDNTDSTAVKQLLIQRYAYALGLDNTLSIAMRNFMSDPSAMISAQMSFDRLGGLPENIEDFERGCAISTMNKVELVELMPGSAAASFAAARTNTVGQEYKRESMCLAARMSEYMTQAELQAYHLSFSYYQGDHSNDDTVSRAKKMGVSPAKYQALEKAGRAKFEEHRERDSNYCNAITYVERYTKERIESDRLKEMGRFSGIANAKTPIKAGAVSLNGRESDNNSKADYLMQNVCQRQGKSEGECECVMTDFTQKVVQRSSRPGVALAWVVMRNSADIDSTELLQLTQQLNRQDQQEAAQLFMSTLDVGEKCNDVRTKSIDLEGDPRARMMKICLADMEDETICNCVVDKMQGQLNQDDFELVVDLRDADFQGAEDPLEKVASDRGLSREQIDRALGGNKSLIGGMMSMDVLSCVGNLPDLGQFQGLQGQ